ncbi:MAG TPA: hypothetical protein VF912_09170 [Anaeromyxobacter sp.]
MRTIPPAVRPAPRAIAEGPPPRPPRSRQERRKGTIIVLFFANAGGSRVMHSASVANGLYVSTVP